MNRGYGRKVKHTTRGANESKTCRAERHEKTGKNYTCSMWQETNKEKPKTGHDRNAETDQLCKYRHKEERQSEA